MNHSRWTMTAVLCFLFAFGPAPGARAFDEEKEKKTITELLVEGFKGGYEEKKAEKILALYAEDAVIIGYIIGTADKERLAGRLAGGMETAREYSADPQVLDIAFDGEVATVSMRISIEKILLSENQAKRSNDPSFMKMRKGDGGWKIFKQSYRPDFQESDFPHGGKAGKPEAPASPPGHP